MLPSLGLFKEIACPYNNDQNTGCNRPFCHFKHIRKGDDQKPSYTATPVAVLEGLATQNAGTSSYPKYVPFPVTQDDESSNSKSDRDEEQNNSIPSWTHTAEYVPKSITTDGKKEEAEPDPDIIIDSDLARILGEADDKYKNKTEAAQECEDLVQLLEDSGDEGEQKELPAKSPRSEEKEAKKSTNGHRKSSTSDRESDRERRSDRSSRKSSSSSSRHRSGESSSSRHKSSSSSSNSSKHSSNKDGRKSSSSSTSSRRDHKSSSSSHSHSSSHKRRHTSDRDKRSGESEPKRRCSDGVDSPSEIPRLMLSSDDDLDRVDDVVAECKMIFEQFDPVPSPTPSTSVAKETSVEDRLAERFQDTPQSSSYLETVGAKKRVAHDAGSMSRPIDRSFQAKPKHMQTALQSVFMRAEAVRKQRAEEEEKAKKELEEKEAQLNQVLTTSGSSTPSSSRRSMVAPVANIIALQNAKKKIEELKMQQQQKTIARSAPRVTGEVANVTKRIAHKATGATAEQAAAPPVLEGHLSKINFNLRMQYYNMMVKHCRAIYDTAEDAWERAQTEELAVFKKCSSPVIYKSSATLAINKLRKESLSAGHSSEATGNKVVSHDVILAGKLGQKNSWSINRQLRDNSSGGNADSTIMSVGPLAGHTFDTISSSKAYNLVAECILDEEQLKENGFPRPGPRPGQAVIEGFYRREQPKPRNEDERYCQRCGKLFNVASYDLPAKDECNYHPKGTGYRRGFADNQHRCCQQPAGTPGCSYSDYHVSNYVDYNNLTGFVKTMDKDEGYVCTRKDIFALDCEMVYTTKELELARVTVVDITGKVVYDACVKPDNHIVDYNTQFSGLTEEILSREKRTLRDIQAVLLSMFHSKTILIGHSLDSDLKALKLIHDTVVDTSVLYPHKMGLPKKKALKTLCIDHLKRIIQENEHGHNSAEDAEVCIQLIKAYLKNRVG